MIKDITDDYKFGYKGLITVALVDEKTQEIIEHRVVPNIITYRAADVMAKSLGDDLSFSITHIFTGGDTAAPGVFPAVSRTDTELDPLTDPGIVPTAVRVELPVVSPSFSVVKTPSAPEGLQQHNVVTYTAIMPSIPQPGDPAFDGIEFFEVGMVARVGSDDILFAHQFHPGIIKQPGFQLVYTWSIRFL